MAVHGALSAFRNTAAATTDDPVVAAVAGKRINVLAVATAGSGTATSITFNSKPAGAGTAISALFANGINTGTVLGYNPKGWFTTNIGEGLSATTGAGTTTGVQVTYEVVA